MSTVVIDYDQLNSIAKNADKSAGKMNDYVNELTKKVSNKYSSLVGGQSSKTSNSQYYIKQKIKKLNAKKAAYTAFASDVRKLSSKAQEIDKQVAKSINASKDEFIDKHDYIETNWWTELKGWFIDMKNKCPLFDAICTLIQGAIDNISNLFKELKHWYKCGGGKELIGVVLAVIGAIAAVVLAICACVPPICGIVAICAAIGAVIAAVNAIVNVATSIKAKEAKDKGDPAWAKIYSDQDTAQDVLRQTNFKDGTLNKLSYGFAITIDVVQTVCDLVAIYDGIKNVQNIYKEMKISAKKGKVSFGTRLKQYIFNSEHYTSTKDNPAKWRDILQKRGKIRTLRADNIFYRATTAKTIKEFNDSFSKTQKFVMKVSDISKHGRNFAKYTQKFFDYTLNGDFSFQDIGKDFGKGIIDKFKISKTISSGYDVYNNNWKEGIKYDIKGFRGLKGLAG